MCNLYSMTKGQQAIRELARVMEDRTGNLPPLPGIFPDYPAPIVRNGPNGRQLAMVRWGMPSSKKALIDAASKRADKLREKGKEVDFDQPLRMEPDKGTTNVRNTASSHWKRWLGPENRCLVPFTSFCEPDQASGSLQPTWFALDESRPLAFFAGIWAPQWTSVRKMKEGEITVDLFGLRSRHGRHHHPGRSQQGRVGGLRHLSWNRLARHLQGLRPHPAVPEVHQRRLARSLRYLSEAV